MPTRLYRLFLALLLTLTSLAHAQIDPRLLVAIQQNNLIALTTALKAGASPNATDSLGATPLMWACYLADTAVVQTLVNAGAKTECKGVVRADTSTYYGNLTGLAAGLNKLPLLRYLLETLKLPVNEPEFNPETKKNDGWTPVEWAAFNGHLEVIKYLYGRGADLNVGQGNPLVLGIAQNHFECTFYLMSQGVILNRSHPAYATTIINLGVKYYLMGEYAKALPLYLEAKDIFEKVLGKNHPDYGTIANNLAELYRAMGDYPKALPLYEEDLAITEKAQGKTHPSYATSLNNLAALYYSMGDYPKALPMLLEAKDIFEKSQSKTHPSYGFAINNLAKLYYSMGDYPKALPLYEEAKTIREQVLGKNHPDYATTLSDLALLYQAMGDYSKALSLYKEAKAIREQALGKNHSYYASTLNSLATLYALMGDYSKALSLYEKAKTIREQVLGKNHPSYASTLNDLAVLYQEMGDYPKALPLYLEDLAIREKAQGKTHPSYATSLNNLALLYYSMGDYSKALPLYEEAKTIREQVLGKNHPSYAESLNNLAELYQTMGNYPKALMLHREAKTICEQVLGKNNPFYAYTLNNLAGLYREMGDYPEALPLYLECLTIQEKAQGKLHPDYASTLNNLAFLYESMGQYQKATPLFQEAYIINQTQLLQLLGFTTQQQQANFLNIKNGNFTNGYSFALDQHRRQPALAGWAYTNALFYNGLLLNAGQTLYRALEQSPDTTVRRLFGELKVVKASLAAQYSRPIAQRYGVDELEKQAETLEQDLTRRSQTFRDIRKSLVVQWPQVQAALRPNEAAIEFVSFQYQNKRWADSILYAAFVIRPGYAQPKFIRLFEQRQLDSLLAGSGTDTPSQINTLYRGGKVEGNAASTQQNRGQALARLVWQPIDSLLAGVQTVYLAPAGQLHQLAFAALPHPADTTRLLGQRYQLRQLGSTRQLALPGPQTATTLSQSLTAQLFGGIRYDADSVQLVNMAQHRGAESQLAMREATRSGSWGYLAGTAQELDSLRRVMPKSETVYRTGLEATEERLKALSGHSPSVLHVATHGFFFPNLKQPPKEQLQLAQLGEQRNSFESSENPLLRSGLVLAGANYVWKGGKSIAGVDDGILTALEVSDLNLSGTQLVVLSACETGLGQIQGSEGVFGLQRSFKLAGAKYLLMSLWKVPDAETAEYMTHLYGQMLAGVSVRSAYTQTQAYMQGKYPQEPYKWAAFVLVE